MSFDDQDFTTPAGDQFGNQYQSPYNASQKKSNKWIWIVLLLVGGGFFLVCCGGFGGLMYFGLGVVAAEVENQLQDHPAIREHIGEIQSFDMNFVKSGAEADDEVFVFDCEGTSGNGTVTAKIVTGMDGSEEIIWAKLRTSDGVTIELVP